MTGGTRLHLARRLAAVVLLLPAASANAANAAVPSTNSAICVRPNAEECQSSIGFGWSDCEGDEARWIDHLEADVLFDLGGVSDAELTFTAAPLYLDWRRQVVGVYVNSHFVKEWLCPDNGDFHDYQVLIPAGFLKQGRNVLTFRMAYQRNQPPDRRELSLNVKRIIIQPLTSPGRAGAR